MINIKKILKQLYFYMNNFIDKMKWNIQTYIILYENKHKLNEGYPVESIEFSRKLLLVPHADDELIGCHALLQKYKSTHVFFLNMTGSNKDNVNKQIREREFYNYCMKFDIAYTIVKRNMLSDLRDIIEKLRPEVVFLPSIIDWHYEHRLVNYLFEQCFEYCKNYFDNAPIIIWYQITVPITLFRSNMFVLMNIEEHKEKWTAFDTYYSSQRNLPSVRFMIREKLQGRLRKHYASENFYAMSFEYWRNSIELVKAMLFEELKDNINDLYKIEQMALEKYTLLGDDL